MTRIKHSLVVFILSLAAFGCSPRCAEDTCTRILFIGNSYIYANDLPGTLTALAAAGGDPIESETAAQGGWRLADHAASSRTLSQLTSSDWDYVILQEQSQIPSVEQARTSQMFPAVRDLVKKTEAVGAKPILFVTWGHRNGSPQSGLNTYARMQAEIDLGYMRIARELGSRVAPVGYVWAEVMKQYPDINLWQDDGSHPSGQGTYLAACVFYAVIFGRSPQGLSYHGNLSADSAQLLQSIAAEVVLKNPKQWNLAW